MHGKLRHARVHRPQTRPCRNRRTNGGTTGTIVAHHKLLDGHARLSTNFAYHKTGKGIGRVPLIGIGLDDNARIEGRGVLGLVFGGVIGMNGVRLVNGQAKGAGNHAGHVGAAHGRGHFAHGFRQYGRTGTVRTTTAHFFVVKTDNHANVRVATDIVGRQGFRRAKDGGQIVETSTVQKFLVHATNRSALGIVERQVPVGNLVDTDIEFFGNLLQQEWFLALVPTIAVELGFGRLFEFGIGGHVGGRGNNGRRVFFRVDVKGLFFVGRLQVNAEGRNPGNGLGDLDQLVGNLTIFFSNQDFSTNTQITVKPGVPKASTVGFDTQLQAIVLGWLATAGFDAQIGTIGMTTNNFEATLVGLKLGADGKGHERGMMDCVVVLATRLEVGHRTAVLGPHARKAGRFQFGHGRSDGVKGIRGGGQKGTGLFGQGNVGSGHGCWLLGNG